MCFMPWSNAALCAQFQYRAPLKYSSIDIKCTLLRVTFEGEWANQVPRNRCAKRLALPDSYGSGVSNHFFLAIDRRGPFSGACAPRHEVTFIPRYAHSSNMHHSVISNIIHLPHHTTGEKWPGFQNLVRWSLGCKRYYTHMTFIECNYISKQKSRLDQLRGGGGNMLIGMSLAGELIWRRDIQAVFMMTDRGRGRGDLWRRHTRERQKRTCFPELVVIRGVFAYDFLESMGQQSPSKHFDILFDIPWFRVREIHDQLEKVCRVVPAFADGQGTEAFQVASDPVLLLHGKLDANQTLQEIDTVHGGDEVVIAFLPVDAGDHVWGGGQLTVVGSGAERKNGIP